MGVQLFERRQGGIRLTGDGEILFKMALPLVEQVEVLGDRFHRVRAEAEAGSLNVAAGGSTLLRVLPEAIEQFKREHPGIELHLYNVTGKEGLAMLRGGEVDFAVGPMLAIPEDLEFRPVGSFAPVLITKLGHPLGAEREVSLEQISRHPMVLPPHPLSTRLLVEAVFAEHGLDCRVAVEVSGWEVIKRYVERGVGISIVMSVCLTGEEKLGVIRVDHYFPRRPYGVVLNKGKRLSPPALAFAKLLLSGSQKALSDALPMALDLPQ